MAYYDRDYIPPVFHTEKANDLAIQVMEVVFNVLKESAIDFCVVSKSYECDDELFIKCVGDFTMDEKADILKEVVEMYYAEGKINQIQLE